MKNVSLELICKSLGIDTREDWRESNRGNIVEINLNTIQDQSYVRCQFKRFLLNCKKERMIIHTNNLERYVCYLPNYDLKSLEGRNKILDILDSTINHIINVEHDSVNKITFE